MNFCTSEQTQVLSAADFPHMPFEHFSSSWLFFCLRYLHVLRQAGRVFALRLVLFIELKVMGHRDDEKTLKLKDQVLSRPKLATWQNLASWSISSSCFWGVAALGRLRLLRHRLSHSAYTTVTYIEAPAIRMVAQAAWRALNNKPCCKAVLLSTEILLQTWPSSGIMC